MTRATEQSGFTRSAPTAQPKARSGARACTIAFLHVCLPPTVLPIPCQGRWESSHAPAVTVLVTLSADPPVVPVPVEHALPSQSL